MPYKPEDRPQMTADEKRRYPQVEQEFTDEGYPVLDVKPKAFMNINKRRRDTFKDNQRTNQARFLPRELTMSLTQDWPSVWPAPKVFSPSSVPLAIRQSYEVKGKPSRVKYANTELLKICNFLHLTPPAVKRHCDAIKQFCSIWPQGLETETDIRKHFPVTHIERNYVQCGPSIRHPHSRIVDLVINVDDLKLTEAEDLRKLKMLANKRYDPKTNMLTISVKDCPSRVQNKDYADYLLRVLFFESQSHEAWEFERDGDLPNFESREKFDSTYKQKMIEKLLGRAHKLSTS